MRGGDFLHKVIITGATSMIGTALIKACLVRNIKVTALVRRGSRRLERLPKSDLIEVVYCGLDDMKSYEPVIADADVFYHFSWASTSKSGGRFDPEAQEPNIRYTLDAVHLAKRFGCKKFVGAGSQAEYGLSDKPLTKETPIRPYMAYGVAKYAAGRLAEMLCASLDMDFVWGRILSVYGPHDNENTLIRYIVESFMENKQPELTPGEQIWDYLYEDDAGEAFLALGDSSQAKGIYNVGSGIGKPLKSFVADIQSVTKSNVSAVWGARSYGKNQVMFLQADITPLTKDTGWMPKVSFIDGIQRIVNSICDHQGRTYIHS